MQGFVAWRDMLNRVLDRADTTTEDRERARFVLQLFTETFAPTNSLLGNPGALQTNHRDPRQEPAVRAAELHRRSHQQFRHAAPGGRAQVPGRPEPRDHARRGGVSRRGVRAHPVHTADRARAPTTAADRAAADQQVLRHRSVAGPQLRRVRRADRACRLSASAGAIRPPRSATGTWKPTSPPASRRSRWRAKSPAPTASTPWRRAPAASRWRPC